MRKQQEPQPAEDRDVRHIEDAGSERAEPDIHEVDHAAPRDAIGEVGRAAGEDEGEAEQLQPCPLQARRHEDGGGKNQPVADGEERRSHHRWQIGAQAQKRPGVLDVLEPDRVSQKRLARLAGKGLGGDVLRHPVAADRRDHQGQQRGTYPRAIHCAAPSNVLKTGRAASTPLAPAYPLPARRRPTAATS